MESECKNSPFLIKLVSLCVSASEIAGLVIRRVISNGDLKVVNKDSHKGKFDPQTEADRLAQLLIVEGLKKRFPKLKIICEEDGIIGDSPQDLLDKIDFDIKVIEQLSENSNFCTSDMVKLDEESVVLWVDPLDGTKSFVRGEYKHVTVSIGIATKSGEAIAGIIHQPFLCDLPVCYTKASHNYSSCPSRTIYGVLGIGIFGLKSRRHLREASSVILISQSHSNSTDLMIAKILSFDKYIASSGAAYKALCVLEDEADLLAYTSGGTKKWDTCAIDAFFKILGGKMTDLYGSPLDYSPDSPHPNTSGVLASLKNHDIYTQKLVTYLSK